MARRRESRGSRPGRTRRDSSPQDRPRRAASTMVSKLDVPCVAAAEAAVCSDLTAQN